MLNEILPSQFVSAMSKFAIRWTDDMSLAEGDLYRGYLADQHPFLHLEGDEGGESWLRWIRSEKDMKTLVFYERLGSLSLRLFQRGTSAPWERRSLVEMAALAAFGYDSSP